MLVLDDAGAILPPVMRPSDVSWRRPAVFYGREKSVEGVVAVRCNTDDEQRGRPRGRRPKTSTTFAAAKP